jgi:trk system potassium uptake protein
MKKQFVVIGLGRFGVSISTTLQNMGHDVLAIEEDEKIVVNISSQLTRVVQADATNEAVLKQLGIADFDGAIVAIGSALENSVLSALVLKKLGVRYLIARANDQLHGSILERIGADYVVYPERETGVRTAHGITLRDAIDYMLIVHGYGISKIPALPHLVGETLSNLGFGPKGKAEAAVLMIQRKNEVLVTPEPGEIIKSGDIIVIAGNDDKVEKLLSEAKKNTKENNK